MAAGLALFLALSMQAGLHREGVRCAPADPMPGDSVTCMVPVSNAGPTTVQARVFIDVVPETGEGDEIFVTLPPGSRKTVGCRFVWPRRDATVSIGVEIADRPRDVEAVGDAAAEEAKPNADLQTILMARGSLDETPHTYDVPVDSSIRRLAIFVEVDPRLAVRLWRPGGAAVRASDEDVIVSSVERIDVRDSTATRERAYTVTAPQPGIWRVEIPRATGSASRRFALVARANSPTALRRCEFVREQSVIDGGYFAIHGMPLVGVPATVRASVENAPDERAFRAVDERGDTLEGFSLRSDDPLSSPDTPVGPVTLPAVPFWMVMNATDAAGAPIRRQCPAMFRAQPVGVFFRADVLDSIAAGSSRRLAFTIANLGTAPATFALRATTSLGEVRDLSPRAVSLRTDESATATVVLAIPSDVLPLDSIDLELSATDIADASVTNSGSANLRVAHENDRDDDSVGDDIDNCPDVPNSDQIDSNHDGVGDACDPTRSRVTITDFTPKAGPAGTAVAITGEGFDPVPAKNGVWFGISARGRATAAVVKSATPTELVVIVPAGVPPDVFVVGTPNGESISGVPFLIKVPRRPAPSRKPGAS